jgi:hypothetical protein
MGALGAVARALSLSLCSLSHQPRKSEALYASR